ncbi:MAG: hypothetical protein Q4E33_05005 [Erysipelotrichaceae bacterium]|nr:hypothetical protein [Erysipelotrichaceae bacterium]
MKKFLTIVLTVLMSFTIATVNVAAAPAVPMATFYFYGTEDPNYFSDYPYLYEDQTVYGADTELDPYTSFPTDNIPEGEELVSWTIVWCNDYVTYDTVGTISADVAFCINNIVTSGGYEFKASDDKLYFAIPVFDVATTDEFDVFIKDGKGEYVDGYEPLKVSSTSEEITLPDISSTIPEDKKLAGWIVKDYSPKQVGELAADATSFKLEDLKDYDSSADPDKIIEVSPVLEGKIAYSIFFVNEDGTLYSDDPLVVHGLDEEINIPKIKVSSGNVLSSWSIYSNDYPEVSIATLAASVTSFTLAEACKGHDFDADGYKIYTLVPHFTKIELGTYELVDYVTKGSKYIIVNSNAKGKALAMNTDLTASEVEIKEDDGRKYIVLSEGNVLTLKATDLKREDTYYDVFQLQTLGDDPKYLNIGDSGSSLKATKSSKSLYVDGDDVWVKDDYLRVNDAWKMGDAKNVMYKEANTRWQYNGYPSGKSWIYRKVEDHTHGEWTYSLSEDGKTITATCNADGCPDKGGHQVSITLCAPERTVYNDGKSNKATIDNLETFLKETGNKDIRISYYQDVRGLMYAPSDAGTYTAKITVGDVTASVEYTIKKAKQPISKVTMNSYVYGDGKNANTAVTLGKFAKPSFDGKVQENAKVRYYIQELGKTQAHEFDIKTFNNKSLDVSSYRYHISVIIEETKNYERLEVEDNISSTFIVAPAEVSLPTALDLTYNGKPQDGFSRKALADLNRRYGVTSSNYTQTDAGTYDTTFNLPNTNYYWQGQEDYVREVSVSWTIKPKKISINNVTLDKVDFIYNGFDQYPNVTVMVDRNWKLKENVDYKVAYDDDFDVEGSDIKNVGSKYARVWLINDNYEFDSGHRMLDESSAKSVTYVDKEYHIIKAMLAMTINEDEFVYNAQEQKPVPTVTIVSGRLYGKELTSQNYDIIFDSVEEDGNITDVGKKTVTVKLNDSASRNYAFVNRPSDSYTMNYEITPYELHLIWSTKTKFVKHSYEQAPYITDVEFMQGEDTYGMQGHDESLLDKDVYIMYQEGFGPQIHTGKYTAKVELTGPKAKNYTIKEGDEQLAFKIYRRTDEDTTPVKTGVDR